MKKLINAALLGILTFGLTACTSATPVDVSVQGERLSGLTLATSGEHTLLSDDFLYWFRANVAQEEMMLRQWGFEEEALAEFWHMEDEDGSSQISRLRNAILEDVLDQATILVLAREAGYTYDQAELREIMDGLQGEIEMLQEQGVNAHQLFFDFYGITIEEFERVQRDMLIGFNFVDGIIDTLTPTRAEVLEYIEENRAMLERQLNLEASVVHILISKDVEMSDQEQAEAYELANSLLQRIRDGEDIRELATIYSEDPGVVMNDGEYIFTRGQMVPEFENWAFAASAGDSAIVESDFGYHIMLSEGVEGIEDYMDILERRLKEVQAEPILVQILEESAIVWNVDQDVLAQISG